MDSLFENWKKYLNEEEINEITEEELSDLDDVLMHLKPEDLSFNNIFGDKMRIITSMQTKDKNLEYLKKTLQDSGYIPDFATGLATYHVVTLPGGVNAAGDPVKPSSMILTIDQLKTFGDEEWQKKHPDAAKKIQKKQVKIGKLLQKGSRLFDIAKKSQNEFEKIRPEDFGLSPPEAKYGDGDRTKTADYRKASEEAMKVSDKDLGKLTDAFPAQGRAVADTNLFQKLTSWWNKKSAFYRENPEAAKEGTVTGENSIIYSRHPIDVLRMSDFDNIESCHSPGSRGGGDSYYKCAVAEAHGHGFIAYAVKNKDLDALRNYVEEKLDEKLTNQELLDYYQSKDREFFEDRERQTGDINPIARLRVKKYTNPSLEVTLAVPEERVYQASGEEHRKKYGIINRDMFVKNVINWTKEKQPKVIKKIEDSKIADNPYEAAIDETDYLDLGNWERHGGTYQDTADSSLFYNLLQPIIKGTRGRPHIDTTTEDSLNIHANLIEQWQEEVSDIRHQFNRRMQAIRITHASAEDDGAGEAYIEVRAVLRLVMDEDNFVTSAFQDKTRDALQSIPQYLIDYGYDWLEDRLDYTTLNPRSQDWADLVQAAVDKSESKIVMEIPIDIEQANPEGSGFAYSPDNFQEICQKLDEFDDQADNLIALAKSYLKREGVFKGGGLHKLASALDEESWYEWSHEIDDTYDPTTIELETTTYVNFNDLIKKIPITFDHQPDKSSEVFIMFAGDPLALASRRDDGEGNFIDFEVRSPEFETERMDGFKGMDAIKEYVQWEVAKMILRPKGQMGGKIPKGYESTRDYLIAMKELMRGEAGGKENEFMFPNTQMWVNGPDGDDEYKMMYTMELDEDTPDDASESALKIITETDDEDLLKKMFRMAFAKVAKIPGANLAETRKYFHKFDFF